LVSGYASSVYLLSIVSFEVRTNYRLPSRLSVPRDRDWSSNNEVDDNNYDDDGGGDDDVVVDNDDDDDEPKNLGKVRSTDVENQVSTAKVPLLCDPVATGWHFLHRRTSCCIKMNF
jgi:hypothetical protein